MLQQTQAARVAPAFDAFLRRFPTVTSSRPHLGARYCWRGTGSGTTGGRWHSPRPRASWSATTTGNFRPTSSHCGELPGVEPYTSAAVASIAFGVPVAAVDTNVRRIVARVQFGVEADDASPRGVAGSRTRGSTHAILGGGTRR